MTGDLWIVIPRWDGPDGFQHYRDRAPVWIKTYTRLMSDDAYLGLTGNRRAILHGLWLEYAMSNRCLTLDIRMIARRLALNVKMADLESLNHAGFIAFSAIKPLAKPEHPASAEKETEKELELQDQDQVPYTHRPPELENGHSSNPEPIAAIIAQSLAAAKPKGTRIE